mgnify:CR=1 FL=1
MTTAGFHAALRICGLSPDEIEAHRNKERAFFGSIPIFANVATQAPYLDVAYPDDHVVGVVAVDAALGDCLSDNWYERLAREVVPIQPESTHDPWRTCA